MTKAGRCLMTAVFLLGVQQGVMAGNPLGLREYTQTLQVEFASEPDAAQAVARIAPLPDDKTIAFSTRWDDNNKGDLRMGEIMKRHGIRGNFYLTSAEDMRFDFAREVVRPLLRDHFGVGSHTMTHRFMGGLNPNRQFYEVAAVRVEWETNINKSVMTYVAPYNSYSSGLEDKTMKDVGEALKRAGYYGLPDPCRSRDVTLGYPPHACAMSYLIVPGDTLSPPDKFKQQVETALNDKVFLEQNPSLTMAMHVWHTEEGLKNVDACFRSVAHRKDWWYCLQDDYAAYRYQFYNARVDKVDIKGRVATFRVTRPLGVELGSDQFVTLTFGPVAPKAILSGGGVALIATNGAGIVVVDVAHEPVKRAPVLIDGIVCVPTADLSNRDMRNCLKFPGLGGVLGVDLKANKLQLLLKNSGKDSLTDVQVTSRLPLLWVDGVRRLDEENIKPGEIRRVEIDLGEKKKGAGYSRGEFYFWVQLDFVRGGVAGRVHVTSRVKPPFVPMSSISDQALVMGPFGKDEAASLDLAALSTPGRSLVSLGSSLARRWFPPVINEELHGDMVLLTPANSKPWQATLNTQMKTKPRYMVVAVDFDVEVETQVRLVVARELADRLFCNGVKIEKGVVASAKKGRSRLVGLFERRSDKLEECLFFGIGEKSGEISCVRPEVSE